MAGRCGIQRLWNSVKYLLTFFGVLYAITIFRVVVRKSHYHKKPVTAPQSVPDSSGFLGLDLGRREALAGVPGNVTPRAGPLRLLVHSYPGAGSSLLAHLLPPPRYFFLPDPQRPFVQDNLRQHRRNPLENPYVIANTGHLTKPGPKFKEQILRIGQRILDCELSLVSEEVLGTLPGWEACITAERGYGLPGRCLAHATNICHQAEIRGFSTGYLLMEFSLALLKANPGARLVHHVRDPRGVYYAGLQETPGQRGRNITSRAWEICHPMEYDLRYIDQEKLLQSPSTVLRTTYDKLVADFDRQSLELSLWLGKNLAANWHPDLVRRAIADEKERYHDVKRHMARWRLSLSENEGYILKKKCPYVLGKLGYKKNVGL